MNTKMQKFSGLAVILVGIVCSLFLCSAFFLGCEPPWENENEAEEQETQSADKAEAVESDQEPQDQPPEQQPVSGSTIRYSGMKNVEPWVWPDSRLDIDNNGETDFHLALSWEDDGYFVPEGANAAVGPLSGGAVIDMENPSSGWFTTNGQFVVGFSFAEVPYPEFEILTTGGTWAGVSNGYMGLAFSIDGAVHYGWLKMSFPYHNYMGTLHDWAYETRPGVGIKTGQTE